MAFVSDTFTDTAGTLLTAHTGETGATWTSHTLNASNNRVITNANRVRMDGVDLAEGIHYASGTPSGADYDVEADLRFNSLMVGTYLDETECIGGRISTAAKTGYFFGYYNGGVGGASKGWVLQKSVAGTVTNLAAPVPATLSPGTTYHLRLSMVGTAVKAYVDGVQVFSATDGSVTAAGRAGIRGIYAQGQDNTNGYHLDNFTANEAVPVISVSPVVTGTRVVGETLTTTDGTWGGSPTSYARKWQRDSVDISGATSATYVPQPADVGHTIRSVITASNANGPGSGAPSNGVAILAEAVSGDIQFWSAAGSGLGGSPDAAIADPTSVFDAVTNSEATAGDIEYRVVYLKNTHAVRLLASTVVWIATQTTSPTTSLSIGVAQEAAGEDVASIANESTPPVGVTFSAPSTEGAGLAVGTLDPGEARGVWLRRTVASNTADLPVDSCTLGWSGTPG